MTRPAPVSERPAAASRASSRADGATPPLLGSELGAAAADAAGAAAPALATSGAVISPQITPAPTCVAEPACTLKYHLLVGMPLAGSNVTVEVAVALPFASALTLLSG